MRPVMKKKMDQSLKKEANDLIYYISLPENDYTIEMSQHMLFNIRLLT